MQSDEHHILRTADGYEIELPGFSGPLDLLADSQRGLRHF